MEKFSKSHVSHYRVALFPGSLPARTFVRIHLTLNPDFCAGSKVIRISTRVRGEGLGTRLTIEGILLFNAKFEPFPTLTCGLSHSGSWLFKCFLVSEVSLFMS